ncbi:MAG TPA: M14 family zinc carboxypeptidase [Gemmatimonadaceae bacterium]|nr:M14 family zinc carboxypeptidase [Gemmatimonadaceae bacterium]
MRRSLALLVLLALSAVPLRAQFTDPASQRPGRNPNQPIDQAYTDKIHQYTTEKFFLSPLVDYMPAKAGVPTPTAELGDIAGAPGKLPYAEEVYAYMRKLEKALPGRVKVYSIGHTEEGREHIAVAIASDELMKNYDANRAKLAKLADPRTINMDDKQAQAIVTTTAPVYYITGTIHSTEAGAPTALMELAYRLAVDESPYVKQIRDHVITLITPVVEVDGRDRVVDVYNWHKAHPNEVAPDAVYWGHYVRHDNNRDAMGMTLKLSENILNTYVDQKAQVLHDLHESVAYLYDNTVGDGPYNSWLDPIVTNEWQLIGWNNVQEMTRYGMPGVFAHGTFDTWSPGYLMFIAATHNGISRLYETFGNGGSADTQERTLSANETSRTWYRQDPPLPRVNWSLRNNNNYEQTGLLVSLNYIASNRYQILENFYEKSKRSILKAHTEGPAAYILTADERRPGAQAQLLRILQKQRVEISRATAPFSIGVPVKVVAQGGGANGGGRGGRGAGRGGAQGAGAAGPVQGDAAVQQAGSNARIEQKEFPAGSYIIRMDQPYSRIADALLDYQFWSPNDPQKQPYDDTGWTFPEGFAVNAVRVTDPKVLSVAMEPVKGEIKVVSAGVNGSGSTYLVNANGDNGLITLRYKLRNADMQAAEEPFDANRVHYNRGSLVITNVSQSDLDAAAKAADIKVNAVSSGPSVKMHPVRAARVAVMHTWQNTQTEGWWRYALDQAGVPYTYLNTHALSQIPDLNARFDVIIFGPGGGSPKSVMDGMPMWRNPIPWKKTALTPNIGVLDSTDDMRPGLGYEGLEKLQKFVQNGGVFIGAVASAQFAVDEGLANGVSMSTASRGTVTGTFLKTRIVDDASPIVYGVADGVAAYTNDGESFGVSATAGGRGGFGGRGGAGGGARETGRGQADDVDEVQGRPALEDRFKAPPRERVQPWEYAKPTDDQLRNPLNIIPPDQRPRAVLRYGAQNELLVSGLLSGGGDIAQRPAVVDSPFGKGHSVLFSINPIYRGETIGTYPLVFNAIMNFDNLGAGRIVDSR